MKRIMVLTLLLGCGFDGENSEAADVAATICQRFCDRCAAVETCGDTCLTQWSTFAGHETKDECSDTYLAGVACQFENGCGDPGCGDPYGDMLACAQSIE